MSTTPSVPVVSIPAPAPVPPAAVPSAGWAWLKAHELLVIVVLGFTLLWFVSGKVESIITAHDAANLTATKLTLAAQVATNQATATVVAQQAADYKALAVKAQAQDVALAQVNATLSQLLAKQQSTDSTMSVSELAARWNVLVPMAGAAVVNGQTTLPDAGAHATVAQLEQVPVLTTQLANEKTVTANTQNLLTAATQQVLTLGQRVDGLNLQLGDADKVCTAQIAVVKAQARKGKRRYFIAGWLVGFFSRQVIKTETGL